MSAAACPACRRPVAVARATCLYCGASLPAEALAAAEQVRAEAGREGQGEGSTAGAAAPAERQLLVVEVRDQEAAVLARVLDLPVFDAEMRLKAGGLQLHRVADGLAEAEAEAARLRAEHLAVFVIPEAEVRTPPVQATGGSRKGKELALRTASGLLAVRGEDLLLVVKGPIRREYQAREVERKKPSTASLEAGYRFHLHRRHDPRPVELDPGAFAFGAHPPLSGSSLLEITGWLAEIAGNVPADDAFRRLPPALGAALDEADPLAPLRGTRSAGLVRRPSAAAILDNVAQYRFYSGWRAGVERRR